MAKIKPAKERCSRQRRLNQPSSRHLACSQKQARSQACPTTAGAAGVGRLGTQLLLHLCPYLSDEQHFDHERLEAVHRLERLDEGHLAVAGGVGR